MKETAFGMVMPKREYNVSRYRFGYNGKEMDNEVKGNGNSLDFGERICDSRLGRWLSIDKLFAVASDWSPYRFSFDNPNLYLDEDGNIELPLYGVKAIDKHTRVYDFNDVYVKASKKWVCQTGMFEGGLTKDYSNWMRSPDAKTIVRTSWWSALRKSTKEVPMTSPHVGTDYKAGEGTPVYSLGDGIVKSMDAQQGNLTIQYGKDLVTFRHLDCIEESFSVGDKVYEGQIVANTGDTKAPGRPHLHVEAKDKSGRNINPESRNFGRVSNKDFFGKYGGDYRKLDGYKKDHPAKNTNPKLGPVPSQEN